MSCLVFLCGFVFLCLVDWVKVWVMSFVVVFIYIYIGDCYGSNKKQVRGWLTKSNLNYGMCICVNWLNFDEASLYIFFDDFLIYIIYY